MFHVFGCTYTFRVVTISYEHFILLSSLTTLIRLLHVLPHDYNQQRHVWSIFQLIFEIYVLANLPMQDIYCPSKSQCGTTGIFCKCGTVLLRVGQLDSLHAAQIYSETMNLFEYYI